MYNSKKTIYFPTRKSLFNLTFFCFVFCTVMFQCQAVQADVGGGGARRAFPASVVPSRRGRGHCFGIDTGVSRPSRQVIVAHWPGEGSLTRARVRTATGAPRGRGGGGLGGAAQGGAGQGGREGEGRGAPSPQPHAARCPSPPWPAPPRRAPPTATSTLAVLPVLCWPRAGAARPVANTPRLTSRAGTGRVDLQAGLIQGCPTAGEDTGS